MPSLVETGFFSTLSTLVCPTVEEGGERAEGRDVCKMRASVERLGMVNKKKQVKK